MALDRYVICQDCKGNGYFPCTDCICAKCHGKGKTSCVKCQEGYVSCDFCKSTGQIPQKMLFIFTTTKECPKCKGLKQQACSCCSKSGFVICTECNGNGKKSSCLKCSGTWEVKCNKCGGTGNILNPKYNSWVTTLSSLTVERLKYEIEKRHQEIQQNQMKISRLSNEQQALWEEYRYDQVHNPDFFVGGGWSPENSGKDREIHEIEQAITAINTEISSIDDVINSKWQ